MTNAIFSNYLLAGGELRSNPQHVHMNPDFSTPPPHVGCGILRDSLAVFFISVISSYNSPKYLFVYTKPVLQTATSPPTIFVDLFHDYTTAKLEGVIKTGQSA
jgi:hypothetical protein